MRLFPPQFASENSARRSKNPSTQFGLNVAASRKTTGNHRLYLDLETALQKFFRSEAAVISSAGYFTNIIAAQGLRGSIDHVLIDERAHGSLRDAAIFLGMPNHPNSLIATLAI